MRTMQVKTEVVLVHMMVISCMNLFLSFSRGHSCSQMPGQSRVRVELSFSFVADSTDPP